MTESSKTLIFVLLAAVAGIGAMVGRPPQTSVPPSSQIGKPLFKDFQDPYEAKSLEIVEFDEELGQAESFKVAQKQGRWVIPSHEDYPADAEDNLKDAATVLVDLKVIDVASDGRQDHELYGVVEPNAEELELGDRGVGKLVVMKDGKGNELADLIIGKSVRDKESQRFVRVPGSDRVYVVEVDPEKLSTNFESWIEDDLLDLNGFDIQQMQLRDYSVQAGISPTGQLTLEYDPRLDMTVQWNGDDFKWELEELLEFRGGEMQTTAALESEEIDKSPLDGMKSALDDLKIVDVRRKPVGLREDLKADKGFLNEREGIQSLFDKGFYPFRDPDGDEELDIKSSDGEVLVRTKDGVEYTLRFGQIAGVDQGDEESTLNRYVMVNASLHGPSFPRPDFEQLPEDSEPQAEDAEEVTAEEASAEEADDAEAEEAEEVTAEEADDAEAEEAEEVTAEEADDAEAEEAEEVTAEEADDAEAEEASDEEADDAEAEEADAKVAEGDGEADIDDERERILKENQRKLDEYKEKRQKGEDRVQELNDRFADWYYVISEDVYKKIHLSRADVLKAKEVDENERVDLESFRDLEAEGLKQAEES